jgi:hypothetical protein
MYARRHHAHESLETRRLFSAPVSAVDLYTLNEDASLVVPASEGVLANDFDPDGPTPPLTAQVVDPPQHGILTLEPDGGFSYTPDADYVGDDGFSYRADDGSEQGVATGVALNVAGVADPGKLGFAATDFTTDESNGTGIVTVVRAGGAEGVVTVDYSTTPGTATETLDYVLTSGTLTFDDGEVSKDILVGIVSDGQPELSETILVTLSNPTGGVKFAGNVEPAATLTIANSSPSPSVFVGDAAPVSEGNPGDGEQQMIAFTLTLSEPGASAVTVAFQFGDDGGSDGGATPGEDFDDSRAPSGGSGSASFAPGETSKTVVVPVNPDTSNEADETVSLKLVDATNAIIADSVAFGTILNDDNLPPVVTDQTITHAPGSGPLMISFSSMIASPDGDPVALTIKTPPASGMFDLNDGGTSDDATDDVAIYWPVGLGFGDDRLTYEVTDRFGGTATGSIVLQSRGTAVVTDEVDPSTTDLLVAGTPDADVIRLQRTKTRGEVRVTINGVDAGVFSPSGRIVVDAGDGDDVIDARGLPNGVEAYGGSGNDTLRGSKGSDLLLGQSGNDTLRGGDRRDVLVGGIGADGLAGGDNDDVLIGGITSFEANAPAARELAASVLEAWTGAADRTAALTPDLVTDDDTVDVLSGGGGNDWFFGLSADPANPNRDRLGDLADQDLGGSANVGAKNPFLPSKM